MKKALSIVILLTILVIGLMAAFSYQVPETRTYTALSNIDTKIEQNIEVNTQSMAQNLNELQSSVQNLITIGETYTEETDVTTTFEQFNIAYQNTQLLQSQLTDLINMDLTNKLENTTSKLSAEQKKLADEAIYLERELCKEAGGWQDQIAASFGGLNRIDFSGNEYDVRPIVISPERKKQLENNLLLFFTGFTRFSSEIQAVNNVAAKSKSEYLSEMYDLVDEAEQVLVNKNRNIDDFGKLLDTTWKLKKQTGSKISTSSIDRLYELGIKEGAFGGKLLGAGGGGFLVFYVPEERQSRVKEAMKDLVHVPFKFEEGGTKIIHYTPEEYTETR